MSFHMANKMLIDATHPEETRVVVVRGNRVEEFDFESAQRKQLRGNIYLAKVTRVEPSLQAAFVEYGGNRHGFLAFSEIHPDYYQIPVADRQALIEDDERAHREAEAESENRANRRRSRHRNARRRGGNGDRVRSEVVDHADAPQPDDSGFITSEMAAAGTAEHQVAHLGDDDVQTAAPRDEDNSGVTEAPASGDDDTSAREHTPVEVEAVTNAVADRIETADADAPAEQATAERSASDVHSAEAETSAAPAADAEHGADVEPAVALNGDVVAEGAVETLESTEEDDEDDEDDDAEEEVVESVGGDDALEEVPERAFRPRRQYKIQEVIKRRQVMLIQVVKEERGNKGAALTTYLSLAGRYAVLMPNTARGGGISRKITSAQDRHRLKEVVEDLDVPEGMGIILRTAGAARTKPEIKRDFEYLLRMWENVRDLTLKSTAPTLVYEEGSLIKRSIRDLYNKDIDEVLVAGDDGYREARDFMKMLMPSHVRQVKHYREGQPLLSRMGVESQLDAMFSPTVQLRSGGYVVINQTEALVSIDVNSGRSTREHHIEDTALKTNLEAAEEIARQLRLRDLAGLIVIDFIDMDEKRNNRAVERKLSDCLRQDRARIQVGRISHFGLLEMSRQRIRASVLESSTEPCPHCGGTGHVRSVASVALQLLRGVEEILMRGATHNLIVRTRTEVALYVLNHKRGHLRDLEDSFQVTISIIADPSVAGQQSFVIDRGEQVHTLEAAKALLVTQAAAAPPVEEIPEDDDPIEDEFFGEEGADETGDVLAEESAADENGEGDGRRRKRRRRRRGGRDSEQRGSDLAANEESAIASDDGEASDEADGESAEAEDSDEARASDEAGSDNNGGRRRRRGRRGGRRRRGENEEGAAAALAHEMTQPPETPDIEAEPPAFDQPERYPAQQVASHAEADSHQAPAHEAPQPVEAASPQPQAFMSPAGDAAPETAAAPVAEETSARSSARRRSTVREKAPVMSEDAPASAPDAVAAPSDPATTTPIAPEPAASNSEADSKPSEQRRVGWWARTFGGG